MTIPVVAVSMAISVMMSPVSVMPMMAVVVAMMPVMSMVAMMSARAAAG